MLNERIEENVNEGSAIVPPSADDLDVSASYIAAKWR